ncbi:uncharacterized protein [Choristoneura fumiferana]|uniref:uncharacterized protein n=1 Tax=Choristoneura fumiferana TaxID=7141 RepID=UPI003D15C9E5
MDLKGLIRVRASYKSKLTQFKSYLEVVLSCESLSNLQLKEINIRLSKFEELYAYFDSTQSDIERLSEIPDDQFKERKEFEDQYYAAVAGAREVLDRHSGAAGGADSLQSAESGSRVNDSTVSVSRYMRTQQLKTHFWSRYYKEYISELQKRQKWHKDGRRLKLGEMVVVKDDRLPPNRWLLGRVTGLHPGSDGVPRVADVYTTSGTLRRAFNRLCPLPILETSVPKGGAC